MATLVLVWRGLLLALTAAGLVSLALGYTTAWRRLRGARPRGPLPDPAPPVTLCKAVEGADESTYELFESLLHIDYPGRLEYLIGTLTPEDPVVDIVARLQAAYPDHDLRLVMGELVGVNRKTSIMRTMAQQATTDLLVFTDGDVYHAPDTLQWLVPELLRPEVGCVYQFPRARPAGTLGGQVIALHYEQVYLPQWMMAEATGGQNTAIGMLMAQRREVMDTYGGFDAFLDALADDFQFANQAARQGFRPVMLPKLIDTEMPVESLLASVQRIGRWLSTIRGVRPGGFVGLIFTYPVAWATVLALTGPALGWTWGVLGAVLALRYAAAAALEHGVLRTGTLGRGWWLLPFVDWLNLYSYVRAYFVRGVVWAGRRYRLLPNGDLVAEEPR